MLRLLVIADVGGEETRHIGDEAMLEANLDGLRRLIPEVAFTLVSRDPAWTAGRYRVDAVAPFGFSGDRLGVAKRGAMLERLLADATGRGREDATIDAVARADALVVSGGGNLSSLWPDLLYERAALMHLARIFGKPAVLLGQTLGPALGADERRLLADTLSTARFVGVREIPSALLAGELGVPPERLWYQCDDALLLEGTSDRSGPPSIAVTIDPQVRAAGEALFGSFVSQLRALSRTTGAPLILVPHAFGSESTNRSSDLTEARVLAERLGLSQTTVAAGLDAAPARQVTGAASLVISSRYHPIVFGLGAAIPSIAIFRDEYCRIKVQGALSHARRDRWALTFDDVVRGALLKTALELWRARDKLRRGLESRREAWRAESRERWSAVLRALDPAKSIPPAPRSTMFGRPRREVAPAIASARAARRHARSLAARRRLRRKVERYASSLRSSVQRIFSAATK